jgi:hypothetical protein
MLGSSLYGPGKGTVVKLAEVVVILLLGKGSGEGGILLRGRGINPI